MPARVSIEAKAWGDVRFDVLAREIGETRWGALGRMAALWGECTERDSYHLPPEVVALYLGCPVGEVVRILCHTALLGEDTPEGIRIRGTEDRIEWLSKARRAGSKGGKSTAAKAAREGGKFVSGDTASQAPAKRQPSASQAPAKPIATVVATVVATEGEWFLEAGRLLAKRKRLKKTQNDLRCALIPGGVGRSQVRRWERGDEEPPDTVRERWVQVLDAWERQAAEKRAAKGPAEHVQFLEFFEQHWRRALGTTEPYPRDTKAFAQSAAIVKAMTLPVAKTRALAMFSSVGRWPIKEARDATLGALQSHAAMFVQAAPPANDRRRVATLADHMADAASGDRL